MSGQLHVPADFFSDAFRQYSLKRRMFRRQKRYGSFGEERDLFVLPGIEIRLVAVPFRKQVLVRLYIARILILSAAHTN